MLAQLTINCSRTCESSQLVYDFTCVTNHVKMTIQITSTAVNILRDCIGKDRACARSVTFSRDLRIRERKPDFPKIRDRIS